MKIPILLALLPGATALAADPPAQTFQIHCSACHAVDHMLVGPSLVEISGIYRGNPDGFVKWCIEPQHKREGVVEMPSMAHLGEPALRGLYSYILQAAEGKTELKKTEGDPYAVPSAMTRRPQVLRIFMPDASPAAIAVALPGDLSYCFDASECRLRYVWKGGFIDGVPYWKANGSSLAKLDGEVVYREKQSPWVVISPSPPLPPEFLGYRVDKDGLPTFRYRIFSGTTIEETIRPLQDGKGITRHFKTDGASFTVGGQDGVQVESSTGSLNIGSSQSKSFTLTYRWK
jgi:cytochrome c551/c552